MEMWEEKARGCTKWVKGRGAEGRRLKLDEEATRSGKK
jgi:hypothetical protein